MKIEIDHMGRNYIISDMESGRRLAFFYSTGTSYIEKFLTEHQFMKFICDESIDFSLSKKRYKKMIEQFKSFCSTFRIDKREIIQRIGEEQYNEIFE